MEKDKGRCCIEGCTRGATVRNFSCLRGYWPIKSDARRTHQKTGKVLKICAGHYNEDLRLYPRDKNPPIVNNWLLEERDDDDDNDDNVDSFNMGHINDSSADNDDHDMDLVMQRNVRETRSSRRRRDNNSTNNSSNTDSESLEEETSQHSNDTTDSKMQSTKKKSSKIEREDRHENKDNDRYREKRAKAKRAKTKRLFTETEEGGTHRGHSLDDQQKRGKRKLKRLLPLDETDGVQARKKDKKIHNPSRSVSKTKQFLPDVSLMFSLSNDPCMKYSQTAVIDKNSLDNKWVTSRLLEEVIYAESDKDRYELSLDEIVCRKTPDGFDEVVEEIYRWALVKSPQFLDLKIMSSLQIPLLEINSTSNTSLSDISSDEATSIAASTFRKPTTGVTVIHKCLHRDDVIWCPTSVIVKGKEYGLRCIRFVKRTHPPVTTYETAPSLQPIPIRVDADPRDAMSNGFELDVDQNSNPLAFSGMPTTPKEKHISEITHDRGTAMAQ